MASMMIAYLALLTIRPWNQFTRIAPRIVEVMEAGDEGDQRPTSVCPPITSRRSEIPHGN
jgi:hypothetical protein